MNSAFGSIFISFLANSASSDSRPIDYAARLNHAAVETMEITIAYSTEWATESEGLRFLPLIL